MQGKAEVRPSALSPHVPPGPEHHVAYYDDGGFIRLLRVPAPDYRIADRCDQASLIRAMQFRPLEITDLIPVMRYRPGSRLFSRFYPEISLMARIVAWVPPELRSDARRAFSALLPAQRALHRTEFDKFMKLLFDAKQIPADGRDVSEIDFDQIRMTTLIL